MTNIFTQHPQSNGESYFEHMGYALKFGTQMLFAGIACILHAIFPFLFPKTASSSALNLLEDVIRRAPHLDARVQALGVAIQNKTTKTNPSLMDVRG